MVEVSGAVSSELAGVGGGGVDAEVLGGGAGLGQIGSGGAGDGQVP